jgi:hypothetical protein
MQCSYLFTWFFNKSFPTNINCAVKIRFLWELVVEDGSSFKKKKPQGFLVIYKG